VRRRISLIAIQIADDCAARIETSTQGWMAVTYDVGTTPNRGGLVNRSIAGALLLGATIGSAHAADLGVRPYAKAPAYVAPQIYDWTGFYVGVNAGIGVGRNRTDHSVPPDIAFGHFYLQPQGFAGGGQVGYNWQTSSSFLGLGPVVFGLEADIQGADMRDGRTTLNGDFFNTNFNQQVDWFGTVRGRIGITNGPVLSYITGGYAYGNVKTTTTQTDGFGAVSTASTDRLQGGYVVGSGIEAALGGNWTGKIEYLYVNLGNKTDAFTGALALPQTLTTEVRENIFRVGLNYRTGGNGAYQPPAAANWTGFYVGGNLGSGVARDPSSLTRSVLGGLVVATDTFTLAPDGIIGGLQAGYNWQAGNVVLGLEADIQGSSQRDNKACVLSCLPDGRISNSYDAKLPWLGTARGRVGYSVGSTLFYATGGFAYGTVKTDITTINFPGIASTTSLRATRGGYAVGGGIETPLTFVDLFGPNWTTKAEYLYVDLGRLSQTFSDGVAINTSSTSVREHIFRSGLNYHFNSPVVAKY
jgi:outer membrane immunogenic protein